MILILGRPVTTRRLRGRPRAFEWGLIALGRQGLLAPCSGAAVSPVAGPKVHQNGPKRCPFFGTLGKMEAGMNYPSCCGQPASSRGKDSKLTATHDIPPFLGGFQFL